MVPGLKPLYHYATDMLASGINTHVAGYNQSPRYVEDKVIDWLRELMGFPEGTTGMLLSGASMANLTALTVARYFTTSASPQCLATFHVIFVFTIYKRCVRPFLLSCSLGKA